MSPTTIRGDRNDVPFTDEQKLALLAWHQHHSAYQGKHDTGTMEAVKYSSRV